MSDQNPEDIKVKNHEVIDLVKSALRNEVLREGSIIPSKLILHFLDKILSKQINPQLRGDSIETVIAKAGLQEVPIVQITGWIKMINNMSLQDRIEDKLETRGYKFLNTRNSPGYEMEVLQVIHRIILELIQEAQNS